MNQPRSTNPALMGPGRLPGQQPPAQPQQQPQSPPGSAGLVGPNGQPIQAELMPLRLNGEGVAIPTTTMNSAELVQHLGGQYPYSMVITWLEVAHALAQRDSVIGWLERRIADLEQGRPSIAYEQYMNEMQQQFAAAMAAQSQQPPPEPPR